MIDKINLKMNLTEKERTILQLAKQGLSDYRIARKINSDPPALHAHGKMPIKNCLTPLLDIEWASRMGVNISELDQTPQLYSFFL
jgi:hypothetical protein